MHVADVLDGLEFDDDLVTDQQIKPMSASAGFSSARKKLKDRGPRWESVLERPAYDLTVFKIHFDRLTIKIYSKGERVLRIEAVAHNVGNLRCGRVLEKFPEKVNRLAAMVEHFLKVVQCIDVAWISDGTLESLPTPSMVGQTRVGGVDINKPRMRAAMAAVVSLAPAPTGFSAAEHAEKVRTNLPDLGQPYTPRHAAYDLKKLRGKGLVRKTTKHSRSSSTWAWQLAA